ncbi:MAG: aldehyde ferredoxin oxidoreductase family protein [Chlorobi bacterium]|nr:aldehyde ferredoxin oxidoreductase family protein [Chlorobiota bacterium]
METKGYFGKLLFINLSTGAIENRTIPEADIQNFIGGRGLGMKILWDLIEKPGLNPLSPENPLILMPGPYSGLPVPSSSRTCVVTKSPHTSAIQSKYEHASTISYSNMGGFIGPEIRFAGYDGIVITGKSDKPVYIKIVNDKVEIKDASDFWGMPTDKFDKKFQKELDDYHFKTCYIGPAGENLVSYACIINTAARAAGRGGTGCVMGSKNLKAIAVKGTKMPNVARHKEFVELIDKTRTKFKESKSTGWWRYGGTANVLTSSSYQGTQAVKNYREGTFEDIEAIGVKTAKDKIWSRDFACYVCPLACKKSGVIKEGTYKSHLVHDGPEYETGTMLGANLMINDINGLMELIYAGDNLGMDIISLGNTIGFLMEAYDKKLIDETFLDGINLTWGNVEASMQLIKKIAYKDGIGKLASKGVKALSDKIGQGSEEFAIHVKGHELAAWNVQNDPGMGLGYATANRGACHMNGENMKTQDNNTIVDSVGVCSFAYGEYNESGISELLSLITGIDMNEEKIRLAGERIFNLEKIFNYREGFRRIDDKLPERFFEDALTVGDHKGAVLKKEKFKKMMDEYYANRGWDNETLKPSDKKLEELDLVFTKDKL